MNTNIAPKTSSVLLRILNSTYRQATKLRNTSDERLADMGLTRQDANRAFFSRYGNKPADRAPMALQTRS